MKRYIYVCMAVLLLIACSDRPNRDEQLLDVNLNLSTAISRSVDSDDEPMPNRYVVEIYKKGDKTTRLAHQVYNTGDIKLRLPVGEYDFYFWADYVSQTSVSYNVADLSMVSMIMNNNSYVASTERVCYAGSSLGEVIPQSQPLSVLLKRPVARINLINDGVAVTQGTSTTVEYTSDIPTAYNVLIGKVVSGVSVKPIATCITAAGLSATDPFAVDYLFVQGSEVDFNVTVGDGTTKNLSKIPLVVNTISNIKASFYVVK